MKGNSLKSKLPFMEPLRLTRTDASSQTLLLDMMSKFYSHQKLLLIEQRQTNKLLRQMNGVEESHAKSMISEVSVGKEEVSAGKSESFHKVLTDYHRKDLHHKEEINNPFFEGKNVSPNNQQQRFSEQSLVFRTESMKEDLLASSLKQMNETLLRLEKSLTSNRQRQSSPEKSIRQRRQVTPIKTSTQNQELEEDLLLQREVSRLQKKNSVISEEDINDFQGDDSIRKNQKSLSQIMSLRLLPYRDKRELKMKISFEDFYSENLLEKMSVEEVQQNLSRYTQKWLGIVYRTTASICWNLLSTSALNFEEIKILFTQNIIFNFMEYMQVIDKKGYSQHQTKLVEVINKISVKSIDYLCYQYPETKITAPNLVLREKIEPINNLGSIQIDFLVQQNRSEMTKTVNFLPKEQKFYLTEIMNTINNLITKTKEQFNYFEKSMKSLFQEVFYKDGDHKNLQSTQIKAMNHKYYQEVKSYTKYLIGSKISKNTELYSEHEIENENFSIKSMPILRIITKWVENLQQIIENPYKEIKETENEFKDHSNRFIFLFKQVKSELAEKIMEHKKPLLEQVKQIRHKCYKMEALLTSQNCTKDKNLSFLSEEQVSIGKYCTNLKSAVSSYICRELNDLIAFLLDIPKKVKVSQIKLEGAYNEEIAENDLKKLNLIHLRMYDLLRCKCISREAEIMYLLERLYSKHKDQKDQFKILRIKDRLHLGTRDILINMQLKKNGLICEMQLSVVSNSDKKQELLDQFNHFLYELKRSLLGPLSECVNIWGTLEHKAIFFQKNIKMHNKMQRIPKDHECIDKYLNGGYDFKSLELNIMPMICSLCEHFYPISKTCLMSVICNRCKKYICGECHVDSLRKSQMEQKKFIFENRKIDNFLNLLQLYEQPTEPLPKEGLLIRKNYLKKELLFYNIVEKEVEEISEKLKKEKKIQKLYKIEFIDTSLRNKQIMSTVINKDPIFAIKKDGDYYLLNKKLDLAKKFQNQIQNFIIFTYAKDSETESKMQCNTWSKILQKCDKTMKLLNCIESPIYLGTLRYVHVMKKEIESINSRNDGLLSQQSIIYYLHKNSLILIDIKTDQIKTKEDMSNNTLTDKLKQKIKRKTSSIDFQYTNFSDQLSQPKLSILMKQPELIQQFYLNLRVLNLCFCKISKMSFVKNFINLQKIYIQHNNLTSLEGIEHLNFLNHIRFTQNQVENLNQFAKLIQIKSIEANLNNITSIDGISKCIELQSLALGQNNLQSIECLKQLKNLRNLFLFENKKINNIKVILELKKLIKINLEGTNLTNLDIFPIKSLQLQFLSLQGIHLREISPSINEIINLRIIDLSNCQISEIENLSQLKKLTILNLNSNKISKIVNVSELSSLVFLKLNNNLIEDISGIKSLYQLKNVLLLKNPLKSFSESDDLEFFINIVFSGSKENEERKASEDFENVFKKWKDFKQLQFVNSDEDDQE